MTPVVVLAPHFRRLGEIFRPAALDRLSDVADIVWARDDPMPRRDFDKALATASAVVFGTWSYGDALAGDTPHLRAVIEVAGAHDHTEMGYERCFRKGLEVGGVAPAFAPAVAEMALGLTLAATRGIAVEDRLFRQGCEHWVHDQSEHLHTLTDRRVGFIGCGGLSTVLHDLLHPFGVAVLGYDPFIDDSVLRQRGIVPADLATLVDACDVVYVLAAPTPTNAGLLSADLLRRLRPHQTLVVISRAHLVDFDALTELVVQGRFRLACDVFPGEPLPTGHPLRRADNAVLSGHRAGATADALLRIGDMVADDLVALLSGSPERRLQYLTADRMAALVQPPPNSRR